MTGWRPKRRRAVRARVPGRAEAGFSLLELAVATVVLGVVLLLAAQGLLEAQRIFSDAHRRLAGGSAGLTVALLRHDVRSARRVLGTGGGSAAGWRAGPLRIETADGARVEYRLHTDRLERVRRGADGAGLSRQVLARRVATFRWGLRGGLFEAELALSPPPPRTRVLRRSGASPPPLPPERVTVALRGTPRTWW